MLSYVLANPGENSLQLETIYSYDIMNQYTAEYMRAGQIMEIRPYAIKSYSKPPTLAASGARVGSSFFANVSSGT